MRTAIYARYSTDLQREASIEDQVRICRQRIEREGWQFIATYSDAASSGASPSWSWKIGQYAKVYSAG